MIAVVRRMILMPAWAIVHRALPLVVAAALAVAIGNSAMRDWLVTRLADGVDQVDEPNAVRQVRNLGKLDRAAIEPLVRAAASNRTAAALAAREQLDNLVDTWRAQQTLNPRLFALAPRITTLAQSLAGHVDEFDEVSHAWVRQLAIDLLELASHVDRATWIEVHAQSELILDKNAPLTTPSDTQTAGRWPAMPQLVSADPATEAIATSESRWTAAPNKPTDDPTTRPQQQEILPTKPSNSAPTKIVARPTSQVPTPPPPLPAVDNAARIPHDSNDLPITNAASASDLALLHQLAGDDQSLSRAAAIELSQRGFGNASPRDARMLLSLSVDDRVALVNHVSTSSQLSAARWLRLLLADGAAEVRSAAMSAIVASDDSALRELAWQTALYDPDPRVAAWTERLRTPH
jgi:hypothetical protein